LEKKMEAGKGRPRAAVLQSRSNGGTCEKVTKGVKKVKKNNSRPKLSDLNPRLEEKNTLGKKKERGVNDLGEKGDEGKELRKLGTGDAPAWEKSRAVSASPRRGGGNKKKKKGEKKKKKKNEKADGRKGGPAGLKDEGGVVKGDS